MTTARSIERSSLAFIFVGWRRALETQMSTDKEARVSDETFDEFLAGQGMLEACEDQAIKETIAAQIMEAPQTQGLTRA